MAASQPMDGWKAWADHWRRWWGGSSAMAEAADAWEQMVSQFEKLVPETDEAMKTAQVGATSGTQAHNLHFEPEAIAELQKDYLSEATRLWNSALESSLVVDDKRFSGDAWKKNPLASFSAALYLLNARTLLSLADAAETDEKTKAKMHFSVDQFIAAAAPSNYLAFNVEAQEKALKTGGRSLMQGVQNLLSDMSQGHVSMTDESVFEVGRNVATTEGAVVFENEFFQLIEYKPLTDKVYKRPFVLVPPCINKYYILDLQQKNSFIRYIVAQGHRTFVISWRNPDESMAQATWDDYIQNAVITAIETARAISTSDQVNTLGFCVGGTMLVNALGVLAARKQDIVSSATLLTTLVDFTDTGVLDVFVNEASVRYRESQMGAGGLLRGQELASTFSFLRPKDLVWNYVVGNYLKGETPPPFDLLYWNSDSTNLPGPYYTWYLRHTYLQNDLIKRNELTVCGEKLDLAAIRVPLYIYGSREDHIVPINGAYASTQVFQGSKRFVMGASGHIAGVINPPTANKRSHWVREDGVFPADVDAWIANAQEYPGSWWTDWTEWLTAYGGGQKAAPKRYGRGTQYVEIEPAPGRYVKVRAA